MNTKPTIETDWSDVDDGPRSTDRRTRSDEGMSFWVSALLGALVSVVAAFVPFSPVLGGGVAGYLHRGTRKEGAKVGAASGALAAVPLVAILTVVFAGVSFFTIVENAAAGAVVFLAIFAFAAAVTVFVSAGLSALGGYLGAYVHEETDDGRREATVHPRG